MVKKNETVVRLRGDNKDLKKSLRESQVELGRTAKKAETANKRFEEALSKTRLKSKELKKSLAAARRENDKLSNSFKRASLSAKTLGGAISLVATGVALKSIIDATVSIETLENKMLAAVSSAEVSAEALKFVREEADRLGLSFVDAADGFAGFSAAALRSGLSLKQTKEIFTGISEAAVSLQLSGERVGLIFRALEQISSKGVLSMEELKLQLGDSLPGALQIAARSMGKTTSEFIKMVSAGEVMSNEFLPNFAKAIKEELGGSVEEASKSARANMERLANSFLDLKTRVGDEGFMEEFNATLQATDDLLKNETVIGGLSDLASGLGSVATFAVKGTEALSNLFGDLVSGSKVLNGISTSLGFIAGGYEQIFNSINEHYANVETDNKRIELLKNESVAVNNLLESIKLLNETGSSGSVFAPNLGEESKNKEDGGGSSALEGKLAADLLLLQDSLLSQDELEIAKHERSLVALEELMVNKLALTEQEKSLVEQLEQTHQDKMVSIRIKAENKFQKQKDGLAKKEGRRKQSAAKMEVALNKKTALMGIALAKGVFSENKALMIAELALRKIYAFQESVINTAVAYTRALSMDPTGVLATKVQIQGSIQQGIIAASGVVEAAGILSSGSGSEDLTASNGSSALASGGQDVYSTPLEPESRPVHEVTVNVTGRSLDTEQFREIFDGLNELSNDGYRIRVS